MSTGDARRRLEQALADHGCSVRGNAAQCPSPEHANGDRNASLSIGQGREGVVLNCHVGCETDVILEALGMSRADLYDEPLKRHKRRVAAEYAYVDQDGRELYRKVRYDPKDFRQYRKVNGQKVWTLGDVRRVLYRLPEVTAAIRDGKTVYLVEGEKDADRLVSMGLAATCNFDGAAKEGQQPKWRPEYGEMLRGADVVIIADRDEPGIAHARAAAAGLGRKAKSVVIMQAAVDRPKADVSDHLDAGFTIDDLVLLPDDAAPGAPDAREHGEATAAGTFGISDVTLPDMAAFTDSELARQAITGALDGRFLFASGLGWMAWDGKRWKADAEADARHTVDLYLRNVFATAAQAGKHQRQLMDLLAILSKGKIKAVTDLAADNPAIRRDAGDFDADPDLLNTPDGIVNLRTGERVDHHPKYLMTKITRGRYLPGYVHPDWSKALEALPAAERTWYQTRIGQGITGHPTPDGVMPVLQGGGENGKTVLSTDGLVPALGDYADVASPKLVATDRPGRSEHSTERADLRGQRLLIGEELSEGRSLDITALKRIMDVSHIKARRVHKDNITFDASHSLFVTTNYVPVVTETDHGTWRRLALLKFPYSFRKSAEECVRPTDRLGDPTLKQRVKEGKQGQHDAIVTWAVEGAIRWYADPGGALRPTKRIETDTLQWRITADRILGFWTERLIADGGKGGRKAPCIWAEEMTEAFNLWLKDNGHAAWSRETFAPRFAEHQETSRHGVESMRTRNLEMLSRRPSTDRFDTLKPVPKQAVVWTSVRFRTSADQQEDTDCAECAESLPNIPLPICDEKFGSDSAHSAQPLYAAADESLETTPVPAKVPRANDLQNVTAPNGWPAGTVGAAAS